MFISVLFLFSLAIQAHTTIEPSSLHCGRDFTLFGIGPLIPAANDDHITSSLLLTARAPHLCGIC
ncbi:hypothetical protein C0Z46_22180 [Salmonella enterica]|nr:hypothetical protein [Salmonella enterica]